MAGPIALGDAQLDRVTAGVGMLADLLGVDLASADVGGGITSLSDGAAANAFAQVYSEDRGLVVSPGVSATAVSGD